MNYTFTHLVDSCHDTWQTYTRHPFVCQLGDGTLPDAAFRHYLQQDYLFLFQFSRAYALAAYKSRTLADLRHAKSMLQTIVDDEMRLHVDYCATWGITEQVLQSLPEARATLAYTRYVLDAGCSGDVLDMHVALAPCVVGYGRIADWLNTRKTTVRGASNPFDAWIAMYESADFQTAVQAEVAWLDARLAEVSGRRFTQLAKTFATATDLEIGFWEMGLAQSL